MSTSPVSGPGGGAVAVTSREQLTGFAVNIGNGANAQLTWNTSNGPNVLLDRTSTANPTIITAGVYIVAVGVKGVSLTVAGRFSAQLDVDAFAEDAFIRADSAAAVAAARDALVTLTLGYYIPAGGTIQVTATNEDGTAARDFRIDNAVIQRLS